MDLAAQYGLQMPADRLMMKAEAGFVITYSSIQTYALTEGQSNYAAASLFQDYVSEYFNRCGNTAVKHINWGFIP